MGQISDCWSASISKHPKKVTTREANHRLVNLFVNQILPPYSLLALNTKPFDLKLLDDRSVMDHPCQQHVIADL